MYLLITHLEEYSGKKPKKVSTIKKRKKLNKRTKLFKRFVLSSF